MVACIKPETFPPEPRILDVRFDRSNVDSKEAFFVYIDFQDGDGDLGSPESVGEANVFLIDPRPNNIDISLPKDTQTFSMRFIEPQGSNESIEGTINIHQQVGNCCLHVIIPGFACNQPKEFPDYDTIYYDIYIKDRAGNLSNILKAPPLVVKCIE